MKKNGPDRLRIDSYKRHLAINLACFLVDASLFAAAFAIAYAVGSSGWMLANIAFALVSVLGLAITVVGILNPNALISTSSVKGPKNYADFDLAARRYYVSSMYSFWGFLGFIGLVFVIVLAV
ncbi:MAG: hypothetical protein LKK13_04520 [Bacilli bacterium]|jgi:hypothetical protein|nr:hypothetical protein [Bacilli bacterium]